MSSQPQSTTSSPIDNEEAKDSSASNMASSTYKRFAKNFSSLSTYSLKTRLVSSGTKESLKESNGASSNESNGADDSTKNRLSKSVLRKHNSLADETSKLVQLLLVFGIDVISVRSIWLSSAFLHVILCLEINWCCTSHCDLHLDKKLFLLNDFKRLFKELS